MTDDINLNEALAAVFGEPQELAEGITAYNLPPRPRFQLGQCMATQGALGALEDNQTFPIVYLKRHESGDWGDLGAADKAMNEAAIVPIGGDPEKADRILSMYILPDKQRIYIITEWDREHTTILLPTEY